MICKKCGGQLEDGARFCPVCGAPCEEEVKETVTVDDTIPTSNTASTVTNTQPKVKTPKPVGQKKSFVGIIVIAAIVLLIGGGVALYFTNPVVKAKAAIKNEKMKDLEKAYKSAGDNSRDKIQDLAYAYFEGIYQQYADDTGDVDWDDMEDLYDDLSKKVLKKYDDFEDLWEEATELHNSRSYYERAEEYCKEGSYYYALDALNMVSKDDAPYQSKVKSLREEAEEGYISSISEDIDYYIENHWYDDAYDYIEDAKEIIADDTKLEDMRSKVDDAYLDYMYEEAEECIDYGWYSDAYGYVDRVKEYITDESKVDAFKTKVDDAYLGYIYDEVLSCYENDWYSDAYYYINLAEEKVSDSSKIDEMKSMVNEGYLEYVYDKVEEYVDWGWYSDAINLLDTAYVNTEDNAVLEKKDLLLEEIKDDRIAEVREDIYWGYYGWAFSELKSLIEDYGEDDPEVAAFKEEAGDAYRSDLLPEVQEYMDDGDYYYALQILYEMDENLPNDEIIQIYIQTCEENY